MTALIIAASTPNEAAWRRANKPCWRSAKDVTPSNLSMV
jgi:hypothetical protein